MFQSIAIISTILIFNFLKLSLGHSYSSNLIPPAGTLSIFKQRHNDFDYNIFPEFVTTHQPAVSNAKMSKKYGRKIQGRLISALNPSNGCTLASLPSIPDSETSSSTPTSIMYQLFNDKPPSWLLLVDNLGCELNTKIQNAASAGFDAILIYNTNSEYEPQIINIQDSNSPSIYTTSINDMDGILLRSMYSYPNEFYIELEEASFVFIDILYHMMLLCFTITSIFVGLLCATWLYDTCQCQRLMETIETEKKAKLLKCFLNKKTMVRHWSSDGPFLNNEACIICLEEFSTKDQIRVLPCLHVFHIVCIDVWMLKMTTSCPICKQFIGTKLQELQILQEQQQLENYENRVESTPYLYSYDHNNSSRRVEDSDEDETLYSRSSFFNNNYANDMSNESIPLLPVPSLSSSLLISEGLRRDLNSQQQFESMPRLHAKYSSTGNISIINANAGGGGGRNSNNSIESIRSTSQSICELLPNHHLDNNSIYEDETDE